jgi:hypothetical protein
VEIITCSARDDNGNQLASKGKYYLSQYSSKSQEIKAIGVIKKRGLAFEPHPQLLV